MTNYIVDVNRYHLAGPPEFWLRLLWDFDSSLVMIPSRQEMVYRLAQRRPLKLPENMVNSFLTEESDTRMLARYGLVPVTSVLATANWSNPYLFVELSNRAPWRQGGAERVNARLEAQDKQREQDIQAKTDAHLTDLSKDAWGYYNMKRGVRTHMWSPKVKKSKAAVGPFVAKPAPTAAIIRPSLFVA